MLFIAIKKDTYTSPLLFDMSSNMSVASATTAMGQQDFSHSDGQTGGEWSCSVQAA